MAQKKRFFGRFEVIFDLAYLCIVLCLGIFLLAGAQTRIQALTGMMALVLGAGDAFHLIPRVLVIVRQETARRQRALGLGKWVTSLSMTIFYVLLWYLGLLIFGRELPAWYTILFYAVAGIRILLCLLPQNNWMSEHPPQRWGIYRNIPFVVLGAMVALFYALCARGGLKWMWLPITLSFACYLPVVLGAEKRPMLGMLMLPKTCAYLWILFLFVSNL